MNSPQIATTPVDTPPNIRMYSTVDCPYCVAAERLLLAKGVRAIEKLRVDINPGLREEMMHKTQRRTVPQIYIGERHVGGYTELTALNQSGRLQQLLTGMEE